MLFSFKPAHKFTQYTNKNDSLPVVPYKPVFKNGNVNLDYLYDKNETIIENKRITLQILYGQK